MDYFSVCLNIFCLLSQSLMHIYFVSRLTGRKKKIRHFVVYIFLMYMLEYFFGRNSLPWILVIGLELLILYGVNRFGFGNRSSVSWTASILAVYISQLSFGLTNSVEALLFPHAVGSPALYLLVIVSTMVSFVLCASCYVMVIKSISAEEIEEMAKARYLLFPVLFFFTAELYIMQTSYTQAFHYDLSLPGLLEEAGKHTALLFLQALGLGALLCTLYAYRQFCRSFQMQAELQLLNQATQAQKIYIAEAQKRYEQTKAFRHDIANHLSVLAGLLNCGKLDESKAYLQRLRTASDSLSFPWKTGNPVVDILLGEKLGLTAGITAEVSVILPKTCGIDSFDLCVIFANALDNAINACQSTKGPGSICIRGERQGDFYMLTFKNSCSEEAMSPAGTGLSNIRTVTEKYHGTMTVEKAGCYFSLDVLLNISLPPEVVSIQKS